jgi:hypothetical protein
MSAGSSSGCRQNEEQESGRREIERDLGGRKHLEPDRQIRRDGNRERRRRDARLPNGARLVRRRRRAGIFGRISPTSCPRRVPSPRRPDVVVGAWVTYSRLSVPEQNTPYRS